MFLKHSGGIRRQMLVAFALLVLLPSSAVIISSIICGMRSGKELAFEQLESVAALKEDEINIWLAHLKGNLALTLSGEKTNQNALALLSEEKQSRDTTREAQRYLYNRFRGNVSTSDAFFKLSLISRPGSVVVTTAQQKAPESDALPGTLPAPGIHPQDNIFITVMSVENEQRQQVGTLCGRASLNRLTQIMLDRSGLGKTGETYLVGLDHMLLTPSRFNQYRQGKAYVYTQGVNTTLEKKDQTCGLYKDYRGIPVFGACRWLPELQAALVAEQYQSEVFAPVYTGIAINLAVAFVCVLLAGIASFVYAGTITNPIRALAHTATRIARGELTLTAKVQRADEIGTLAMAFNSMTGQLSDTIGDLKARLLQIEQAEEALQKANIELEQQVEKRTVHLKNEIQERQRAQEAVRLNESRLEALLKLSRMDNAGEKELADFSLEEAIRLTNSKIGYLAFMNADEKVLSIRSWSKQVMQQCKTRDKPIDFPVERGGLWGEAVRQRKPMITNDYQAPNPLKKGYPEGHVKMIRYMNIPVFDGERIVAVAALGNKENDYDESDARQLTLLMQGMWQIIQRKRADEDKKRLAVRLQQIQKLEAIATLAGGIAHEFNNALAAVVGNLELLQMHLPDHENVKKFGHVTERSIYRLTNLTNLLLAYARQGKYWPENVNLSEFVKSLIPMLIHDIAPGINIETDLSSTISTIKADIVQLQMLMSAILKNASEATKGQGRIRVITSNKEIDASFAANHPGLKPGCYVGLTVEDHGKGMDEKTKSRIFEPFFTTNFQGRGLGMAAVYGIIKNHGGYIYIDSEPGQGTAVRILLPPVETEIKEATADKAEITRGAATILVIEDEEMLLNMIRSMLEMKGYLVLGAKTGKEALDMAQAFSGDIDLALLDMKLPDMAGAKLYPMIKQARPNLKVIVCTGYSLNGPARKILNAGAQGFIQKPFSLNTLTSKVEEVLENP
jgi:signal transduction histidine kinase/ActR/RegA family two-component response regulator/HAMP domain-containing protein